MIGVSACWVKMNASIGNSVTVSDEHAVSFKMTIAVSRSAISVSAFGQSRSSVLVRCGIENSFASESENRASSPATVRLHEGLEPSHAKGGRGASAIAGVVINSAA